MEPNSTATFEELCDKYLWIRKILAEPKSDKDYATAKSTMHELVEQLKKSQDKIMEDETFTAIFEALAKVLVLSIDRLDFQVLYKKWLPSYEGVRLIHGLVIAKCEARVIDFRWELAILGRIYIVCTMQC